MVLEYVRVLALPAALAMLAIAIFTSTLLLTSRKRGAAPGFRDWKFSPPPSAPATQTSSEVPDNRSLPFEPAGNQVGDEIQPSSEPSSESSEAAPSYLHQFITAKTEEELERAYSLYQSSGEKASDGGEFWKTFRVVKRRDFGVADEERELSVLAEQNCGWVWPLIYLIRRYVRLQDIESAERTLAQALARKSEDGHKWVLQEAVKLHYKLHGLTNALEFIRNQLLEGVTDDHTKIMFGSLAEIASISDDPFSFAVPREISLCFEAKPTGAKFDLAYAYGNNGYFALPAYQHYKEILEQSEEWSSSPNNMGVILHAVDLRAEVDLFERARKLGSRVAVANLANKLVDAGFLNAAEDLLANAPEGSDAEENIVVAKNNLLRARREMTKAKEKFQDFVVNEIGRYRSVIMEAFRYMKQAGFGIAAGGYENPDHTLQLIVETDRCRCRLKMDDKTLQGDLNLKPMCYDGFVMTTTGGLLNSLTVQITVFSVGEGKLKAVLWPSRTSTDAPLKIVDVHKVDLASSVVRGVEDLLGPVPADGGLGSGNNALPPPPPPAPPAP